MKKHLRNHCFQVTLLSAILILAGCSGSSSAPRFEVTGQVTFQGQPVQEGVISFESPSTGYAATCDLNEGAYTVSLPESDYIVLVQPVEIQVSGGPDSPPSTDFKNVKDIPPKYRELASSDLKASVTAENREFDFDLKP